MKNFKVIAVVLVLAFTFSLVGCKGNSNKFKESINKLNYTKIEDNEDTDEENIEDGFYQTITDMKYAHKALLTIMFPPMNTLDNTEEMCFVKRDITDKDTNTIFAIGIFEMNSKEAAKEAFEKYEEAFAKQLSNTECDDMVEIDDKDDIYAFAFSVDRIDAIRAVDIRIDGKAVMFTYYTSMNGDIDEIRSDYDDFYKSLNEESPIEKLS